MYSKNNFLQLIKLMKLYNNYTKKKKKTNRRKKSAKLGTNLKLITMLSYLRILLCILTYCLFLLIFKAKHQYFVYLNNYNIFK